ncbi:disintegrin and metalloproteinase domain-containing protein 2-like [Varanus komodoensis]|uniref:disintegrin and metalloproteinase domain-containing protein 2-like n=1 Tax=Varanus komodoensis TaxID=61221 RepID=UPI001CF7B105|nr:disintegrin and metalloproteinase domain-containing protein 2-like [Varanus komodoensis]
MALLRLAGALLTACLVSVLGSRRTLLQVIVPQRVPVYASGNTERMSYDIVLGNKLYTIHLKQQSILANDFRVYTYTHSGSVVSTTPSIQRDCYYQGYVETYTNSLVTLSTCTGLSGVLLFENLTYGIEPVTSTSGFQHLVYQIEYSSRDLSVSKENYSIKWSAGMNQRANPGVPINFSTVRYVEMHVIVAKSLYDFMGSNEDVLARKITQLMGFLNTMFFKLNLRIILSSLELWIDRDKISTLGTAEELLEKFVEWKQTHLALRPHDVSFLFVYRKKAPSVGSTFARKMCVRASSAGVAVYQDGILLETFSVIVAQLLGISLGLHFDNSRECFCPVSTCVMNTKAVQSNGAKFFSSCSVKDFRNFLGFGSSQCLLNRPRIDITYRSPSCGNRVLEEGEQCDCGSAKQCESSPCCQSDCTLKSGKECAQGPCCVQCKLRPKGTLCRDTVDEDCDLKEYCNGTSAECTEDFFVQDGQTCEADTGVCMKGICQSPDRWCRKIFGKDSRSGSLQCYEEINSQNDRMGHCGSTARGYQNCQWQLSVQEKAWTSARGMPSYRVCRTVTLTTAAMEAAERHRDLKCGKLVCEYPSKKPFVVDNTAIIYAKVQNRLCVTLDYMKGPGVKDPFLVQDGTGCGKGMVRAALGAMEDPGPDSSEPHGLSPTVRNWLLIGFFLFLPVIVGSVILIIKLKDVVSHVKVQEEDEEDYDTEGSKSQGAAQPDIARPDNQATISGLQLCFCQASLSPIFAAAAA